MSDDESDRYDIDDIESRRLVIQEQSALIQSLDTEINQIAKLHALSIGVVVTGISIGQSAGVIDIGFNFQSNIIPQIIGILPLIAVGLIGLNEIFILSRSESSWWMFPIRYESFPPYMSELRLEPTNEALNDNAEIINTTEEKIPILHIHFVLALLSLLLWGITHVVTPLTGV